MPRLLLMKRFFQIYTHLRAQTPVHETSFLERHPPFTRFARPISVQFLNEPRSEFLADLYQILAKVVCICATPGWCIVCIEREISIAGNGEIIDGKGIESFGSLYLSRRGACAAKLRETVGNEEDEDYEKTITGPFDLEVSEERVGAEEVECLVDDVSLFITRCEGGRAAYSCFDGVDPKVSDLPDIWLVVQSGMIRRHGGD